VLSTAAASSWALGKLRAVSAGFAEGLGGFIAARIRAPPPALRHEKGPPERA
jgi:hypothetical protein